MKKWILTKELFDSDILKNQNEIPYLQGNLNNSYTPLGEEKMNLNTLLLTCPFFGLCFGNNANEQHYASYEEGIYLFIFINDYFRYHIALDLKDKKSIGLACLVWELPIDVNDIHSSRVFSYSNDNLRLDQAVDFLLSEGLENFRDFNFLDVIRFNQEVNLSKMN